MHKASWRRSYYGLPKAKPPSFLADGVITRLSKSASLTTASQIPRRQVSLCFPIGRVLGTVSVINEFEQPTVSALHVRHSSRVLESQPLNSEPSRRLHSIACPGRAGLVSSTISCTRSAFYWRSLSGGRGRSARRQAESNCRSRASCLERMRTASRAHWTREQEGGY